MDRTEVLKRLTDSRALLELSNSSGKYRWWMVLDHLRVIGGDAQTPPSIREHASAIHKTMQSRDATRWTRWGVAKVELASIIAATKSLSQDAWAAEGGAGSGGETAGVPEAASEGEAPLTEAPLTEAPQASPGPRPEFTFATANASDPPPLRGRGRGDRR